MSPAGPFPIPIESEWLGLEFQVEKNPSCPQVILMWQDWEPPSYTVLHKGGAMIQDTFKKALKHLWLSTSHNGDMLGVKSHNWLLRQTRSFEDKSVSLEGDDQDSGCATVWSLMPLWDTASWTGGHGGPAWQSVLEESFPEWVGDDSWTRLCKNENRDNATSFSVLILVLSVFN